MQTRAEELVRKRPEKENNQVWRSSSKAQPGSCPDAVVLWSDQPLRVSVSSPVKTRTIMSTPDLQSCFELGQSCQSREVDTLQATTDQYIPIMLLMAGRIGGGQMARGMTA